MPHAALATVCIAYWALYNVLVYMSLLYRANGGSGGGPCPSEDAWTYEATSGDWIQLDNCPTPRVWSQMAPLTNRPGAAVLYGGSEKEYPSLISVS